MTQARYGEDSWCLLPFATGMAWSNAVRFHQSNGSRRRAQTRIAYLVCISAIIVVLLGLLVWRPYSVVACLCAGAISFGTRVGIAYYRLRKSDIIFQRTKRFTSSDLSLRTHGLGWRNLLSFLTCPGSTAYAWATFSAVTVWWGLHCAGGIVANGFGFPVSFLPVWVVCFGVIAFYHYSRICDQEMAYIEVFCDTAVRTVLEFGGLVLLTGFLVIHTRCGSA